LALQPLRGLLLLRRLFEFAAAPHKRSAPARSDDPAGDLQRRPLSGESISGSLRRQEEIETPLPYLTFTDHRIRIYPEAAE